MTRTWDFELSPHAEPPYEAYVARRGIITAEIWRNGAWDIEGAPDPAKERWYGNYTIKYGNEELYMQVEDNYETFELAKIGLVDRIREFVETLHADFRGAF